MDTPFGKVCNKIIEYVKLIVIIFVPLIISLFLCQSKVDSARSFGEVFQSFSKWLERKQLGTAHNFSIATDW